MAIRQSTKMTAKQWRDRAHAFETAAYAMTAYPLEQGEFVAKWAHRESQTCVLRAMWADEKDKRHVKRLLGKSGDAK